MGRYHGSAWSPRDFPGDGSGLRGRPDRRPEPGASTVWRLSGEQLVSRREAEGASGRHSRHSTPPPPIDRVVLPASHVRLGDCRPVVKIFVGTEHAQYRAERIFVWSIEQVRDPTRTYEIHLMKDLSGFDRRRWLTGFTNYRFVVAHLANGVGRAIYNDIDQIYLSDPAELFDTEMGRHGFLSINPHDTSVMLIDCDRMSSVWTPESARRLRRKKLESCATAIPDLWGRMPEEWNARDQEYVPGQSKLIHFTTIHTQPWMPFPKRFIYQRNPVGSLWHELERSADDAGYDLFSETRPTAQYRALLSRLPEERTTGAGQVSSEELADRDAALASLGTGSVLEYGLGQLEPGPPAIAHRDGRIVTRHDPCVPSLAKKPCESFDAVVCSGGLECLADEDVPWMIESFFRFGRRLVYAWIGEDARERPHPSWRAGMERDRFWWSRQFELAAARHPDVAWRIVGHEGTASGRHITWARERTTAPPKVWVLADDKAGHSTQSLGLAAALGWPYELRSLRFNRWNRLSNRLLGAIPLGLDRRHSDTLGPPWPDVVIGTGRRVAPVARWIAKQSRGHTRLVQLGRKGGDDASPFDLVVTCAHFRLLPHPRRFETVAPLNGITEERLAEAEQRWKALQPGSQIAPIALLVGGRTAQHRLSPETARKMAREVSAFARAAGRSVVAITSPRTGAEATDALAAGLEEGSQLYRWRPGDPGNPYLGALALCDSVVVTGDSESMLGEAVAAGKPVYIYPVPERRPGVPQRVSEWIVKRAHSRPRKQAKGSVRPQQKLEALCSRLLSLGIVRVRRDLDEMHRGLIRLGVAQMFGASDEHRSEHRLHEIEDVAERVRALFGFAAPWHLPSTADDGISRDNETAGARPPGHTPFVDEAAR